jgi:hypothetical protein
MSRTATPTPGHTRTTATVDARMKPWAVTDGGMRFVLAEDESDLEALVESLRAFNAGFVIFACVPCATLCVMLVRECKCCAKNRATHARGKSQPHRDLMLRRVLIERAEKNLAELRGAA